MMKVSSLFKNTCPDFFVDHTFSFLLSSRSCWWWLLLKELDMM